MATLSKGKTFTNGETVTPQKLHELVDLGTVSGIVNADISASAAIADTKLAQITTAGKVLPAAVQGTAVVTADPRLSDARTPVSHTHAISDTTGLQAALDGKQAAGSYAAASHTHDDRYYTETEMNSLLAGKQASGSYAPATGIAPSAITGTAVITTDSRLSDARTPLTHTHDDRYYTETEMNTLLAGKQASGSYAPATGIAQSAVTNLTTDLAGKAASSHTHDASAITAGTLANARTTATSDITANAIVARDSGGGISAQTGSFGTINGFRVGVNENDLFPNYFMIFWNDTTAAGAVVKGSGDSVSYTTVSDYRLKTNIEPLTAAVSRLLQIPVHRFNWLADPTAPKVDGFLAHEAQAIVPESVTGHKDEVDAEGKPIHQGIDQSKLVPLLVAAVQELAARVAALEAR